VDLNVVMTGTGHFVEVQGTAEGAPFGYDTLIGLVNLAREGIEQLLVEQTKLLTEVGSKK
jgi:ribonuclease PH